MKLFNYIDKDTFEQCVKENYLKVTEHPTEPGLRIINYTKQCNAEKVWNSTTLKCRGLIIDKDDEIIARPFKKFFNIEEHELYDFLPKQDEIDKLIGDFDISVYDKLDGSLGILYWIGDVPYIATKGAFDSEQALHATKLLHTKYRHTWDKLLRNKTYLFEIIYPQDLHVVKYDDTDDIFLLAVLSTENNFEYPPEVFEELFPVVKRYYVKDWKNCREIINGDNREGFVIRIGELRIKMKYKEYWRLYSLKAGLSEKLIYQCLVNDDMTPVNEALELFDEENIIYYNNLIKKYTSKFGEITDKCVEEYRTGFASDKEAAEYFNRCTYPGIMFAIYRGKTDAIRNMTWKYVAKEMK